MEQKLKAGDSVRTNLEDFTDEQIDLAINHIAVLVRATMSEWDTPEEVQVANMAEFNRLFDEWPEAFADRVRDRIILSDDKDDRFWDAPSDTVLSTLY